MIGGKGFKTISKQKRENLQTPPAAHQPHIEPQGCLLARSRRDLDSARVYKRIWANYKLYKLYINSKQNHNQKIPVAYANELSGLSKESMLIIRSMVAVGARWLRTWVMRTIGKLCSVWCVCQHKFRVQVEYVRKHRADIGFLWIPAHINDQYNCCESVALVGWYGL